MRKEERERGRQEVLTQHITYSARYCVSSLPLDDQESLSLQIPPTQRMASKGYKKPSPEFLVAMAAPSLKLPAVQVPA